MDYLQQAIHCYATAIKLKPKDANFHLQLGMLLEEKYYIEDIFGLKKEVQADNLFCFVHFILLSLKKMV
jgi:hypothetical protein